MKTTLVLLALTFSFTTFADDDHLPDRTTAPTHPTGEVEVVHQFAFPPMHITVSKSGRMFLDALTQDSQSKISTIELVDGKMVPFPDPELQKKYVSVHGMHVDGKDRLWILDHGDFAFFHAPRVYAYDINTGEELVNYEFPPEVAPLGSMLNDVFIDETHERLFISDTGPIFHRSAIIIYDIKKGTSRRVLDQDPTLSADKYAIYVEGTKFSVLDGMFTPKYGIDGINLDPNNEWFYYSAFNRGELYRIPVAAAIDENFTDVQLSKMIEKIADITMSDGMLFDPQGRYYLSDVEHSAVVRLWPDGKLETMFKDPKFRWPTGYSMGPDGYMYFTCTSINQVTLKSRDQILALGPYYLFRFRP